MRGAPVEGERVGDIAVKGAPVEGERVGDIAVKGAPVDKGERIGDIDVIRGVALFGVLAMNLALCFRVPMLCQKPELVGFDRQVLQVEIMLMSGKAMSLFSMLFGVGLCIFVERASARGHGRWLLARRLLFLLLFGLAHLFLLWTGDILVDYALAGLVALAFLGARSVVLVAVVLALTCFPLTGYLWPALKAAVDAARTPAHYVEALRAYGTGSYPEIVRFRASEMPLLAVVQVFYWPEIVRNMLVGMLVWRSGVLRAPEQHLPALRRIAFWAIVLGGSYPAGLTIYRAIYNPPPGPQSVLRLLLDAVTMPMLALGYGTVLLLLLHGKTRWRRWLGALAPLGRMAFTNYLTQTMVFTTVFYGYGLGLIGRVSALGALCMGIVVYTLQVAVSTWWLRRYRFGPFEWLWRSLTYGRLIRGVSVREGEA